MTKKEYNGWGNYETWLTALWIDNDQSLQSEVNEAARRSDNIEELSTYLKELIHEMNPIKENGLFCDFANACISEINFCEIASNYMEEVEADNAQSDASAEMGDKRNV